MLKSKPILVRISGDFWDSHIYSNQLYLFGTDKSLLKVDWRALVVTDSKLADLNLAAHGIMVDAGFFYRDESRQFLADQVVLDHVKKSLDNIQGLEIEVDLRQLTKKSISDSPFPNLHTDCEIYHHRIYGGMPEGLFLASASDESGARKLWDSSVAGVRASESYSSVAVAAGDEGLWEFSIKDSRRAGAIPFVPTNTTKEFCTACDWGDQSIYGWSAGANGFLASYYTERRGNEVSRIYDRTISSVELGSQSSSFWGSHGRAYTFSSDGNLEVFDYDSKAVGKSKKGKPKTFGVTPLQTQTPIKRRGRQQTISTGVGRKRPVAVATAPFGTVIQFGDMLLVVRSDGEITTISGDIVSWRVFPRSLNYANQLHVVFDDRLEIYAFLHDYFVDQSDKDFGYSV